MRLRVKSAMTPFYNPGIPCFTKRTFELARIVSLYAELTWNLKVGKDFAIMRLRIKSAMTRNYTKILFSIPLTVFRTFLRTIFLLLYFRLKRVFVMLFVPFLFQIRQTQGSFLYFYVFEKMHLL